MGGLIHLTEAEIDRLIYEEEGITIKEYIEFLTELQLIKQSSNDIPDRE